MRAVNLALVAVGSLTWARGAEVPGVADVSLLVRSQDTAHDRISVAELTAEVVEAGWPLTSVVPMHEAQEQFQHMGLWSLKPWLYFVEKLYSSQRKRSRGSQRWVVFLEPATRINSTRLGEVLSSQDSKDPLLLGRKHVDAQPSIIHHFRTDLAFPFSHSGFAISAGLLKRFVQDLEDKPLGGSQQIEPVFELTMWAERMGTKLDDHSSAFCAEWRPHCATWVVDRDQHRKRHGLRPEDVVIGVKAVEKFHESRIPVVHKQWARSSPSEVLYLTNAPFLGAPPGAQIVDLSPEFGDAVDPKKESNKEGGGHCSKMTAMLQYLANARVGKRWYVITDDDTLLNVPRLLRVLDSYDDQLPGYLGERYGWAHKEQQQGTNYITTGGGMALSGPALERWADCHRRGECRCNAASSPDDMALGNWMKNLKVQAMHEEGFHQSEPKNYHPEMLRYSDPPVSFHRFDVLLASSVPETEQIKARHTSWSKWIGELWRDSQQPIADMLGGRQDLQPLAAGSGRSHTSQFTPCERAEHECRLAGDCGRALDAMKLMSTADQIKHTIGLCGNKDAIIRAIGVAVDCPDHMRLVPEMVADQLRHRLLESMDYDVCRQVKGMFKSVIAQLDSSLQGTPDFDAFVSVLGDDTEL